MMSQLFQFGRVLKNEAKQASEPNIRTPFGVALLSASLNGSIITRSSAIEAFAIQGEGSYLIWDDAFYRLELIIARPKLNLPPGMIVTECWVGMWRLHSKDKIDTLSFSCELIEKSMLENIVSKGPNSGECLTAYNWESKTVSLHMGTMDGNGLLRYGLVPERWSSVIDYLKGKEPTFWSDTGLFIDLPAQLPGEQCQIQFVLAWEPVKDSKDSGISSWFAVDMPPDSLLAPLGCK